MKDTIHPDIEKLAQKINAQVDELVELIIQIQQIPAPTFEERERAKFIQKYMAQIGLVEIRRDKSQNVYGRLPSSSTHQTPIIVSAHSDTVFSKETDLSITRRGKLVFGPGIGDNSTGVGGILFLAKLLAQNSFAFEHPIWFVSNVGEEGLGDLCGMKAVVERFGSDAIYIVVEGGLFGQISHQAIGVQRFKIEVETEGGHSWGSFGKTSAIHVLGQLISQISDLQVPTSPKTTFNVGVIEGGTSVNTIAQTAHMLLDLRSESTKELEKLTHRVRRLVDKANVNTRHNTKMTMSQIGNRPAGRISRESRLVQHARSALKLCGVEKPVFITSSTDSNIPLSQGIHSVCVGLTESSNAHRLDEFISLEKLPSGLSQLLYLLSLEANFDPS